jgi:hypothetical protein
LYIMHNIINFVKFPPQLKLIFSINVPRGTLSNITALLKIKKLFILMNSFPFIAK